MQSSKLATARLAAALVGWLAASGCGEEPPAPEPQVRPVKILEIGEAASGTVREYPGTIAAAQHAEMGFEVAGRVVEFPVDEGMQVEEGAVLAKLDPRDYQARLDSAAAVRNNARVEYQRAQTLFDEGVTAKAERDRKLAYFEMQDASYRETEKAFEDTVLRAPFAGVVASKLVKDFRNVQAKEAVLILQDDSSFEIEIFVPERDVTADPDPNRSPAEITARVQPRVSLTSLPDRSFTARVKELSTTADPTTRTFRVTLAFDKPADARVLPGMTAKIQVRSQAIGADAGVRIPASAALAGDEGGSFVWLVDPATMIVARRAVELGELSGSEVLVSKGLAPGDQLAVSGVHQLREGMQVSRYQR